MAGSISAIVVGMALLAGIWLLPDLTPDEAIPVIGQESLHGRIVGSLGTDAAGLPLFVVEVLDGPGAGERVDAAVQRAEEALPGRVGRSHIAAMVNTLVLAYLGAGLPLLLLFALGGQSPVSVLNSEIVASR